jgi:CheY-like chemotaxis protein
MKLAFWNRNKQATLEEPRRGPVRRRAIRVLMVDDETGFTRTTKRNLEAAGGMVVETINRAQGALQVARDFQPDVVLLDVMMPDGDGGSVAAEFASDPDLSNVPIMFLTAAIKSNEVGRKGAGYIAGRLYIAKPVQADNLIALIQEHAR